MSNFRPCPACGHQHVEPAGVQPKSLLQCLSCRLIFEARIPSDADLAFHYSNYNYNFLRSCSFATQSSFRKVLQTFIPWRGQGRLLDIGCGQGDFLQEARTSSWNAVGIEFSPAAVSLCLGRGLQVFQATTEASSSTLYQPGSFDVVTAFEVLEHLRAPGDLLNDASKLLVSGGLLYLTTPNYNSFLRHLEGDAFAPVSYPDHLCLFTPTSLRSLAARHGFRVAALRSTGLDPWRLKHELRLGRLPESTDSNQQSNVSDSRTALRSSVYKNRHMALLKATVNSIVNVFGVGDTLKAWLVKI